MSQSQPLPSHIEQFLHTLEGEQSDQEQQEPEETIHVYVEEDRVTFVRETPETIDSIPPPPGDSRSLLVAGMLLLFLVALLVGSVLAPQPVNSKSFAVTIPGYTQTPVQKSVTVKARATGNGFIAPTTAAGIITFYNGQPYTQIIPTGTILKGQDGVTVITDEQAIIPPVTETFPPTDGQISVPAHALVPGASGNIVAGDINQACCVTSVIAQNPAAFTGGRDGQHFSYVTKQDVYHAITPLLTRLEAQTPQLFTSLALSPHCAPTIVATPTIGQRATTVSMTATVRCTALSYDPHSVLNAIHTFSSRFGPGTLSNIAYQVIAISKDEQITFFVTAMWNPLVARHLWTGK